jgi:hypothetical protein
MSLRAAGRLMLPALAFPVARSAAAGRDRLSVDMWERDVPGNVANRRANWPGVLTK